MPKLRRGGPHRDRRRSLLGLAAATALVLLTATPAQAADLLGPENSESLADKLRTASQQQDICYGWDVTLYDEWRSYETIRETGSNLGVGVDPRTSQQCRRWVVFEASITWTSSVSESEDSASFDVEANIPGAPDITDLERIGVTEDMLLGDHDARTVFNAVAALPQLVAENSRRFGPPTASPTSTPTADPGSSRIAGSGGSDFLRSNSALLGWAVGAVLVGVAWLLYVLVYKRRTATIRHRPPFGRS